MPAKKKNTSSNARKSAGRKPRVSRTAKKQNRSAHARDLHARANTRPVASFSAPDGHAPAAKPHKQGFSFPIALSQVRDRVYTRAQGVKSTHHPVSKKKELPQAPAFKPSPYILDLKHRRTVVHGFAQRKPVSFSKMTRTARKTIEDQGVLSLFDDQGSEGLPLSAKAAGIFSSLRARKNINLIPMQKQAFSRRMRRQLYTIKWQWQSFGRLLISPFTNWKYRRLQRTLSLPVDFTAVKPVALARVTRGGQPISVSRVAHLLKRRTTREEGYDPKLSLSRLSGHLTQAPSWRPSISWARASVSFAVVSLLLVSGVGLMSAFRDVRQYQMEVLGATNMAIGELKQAQSSAGQFAFIPAAGQFEQAGQAFQVASAVMKNQAPALAKLAGVIPGANGQIEAAATLLTVGKELSEAAKFVSQGVSVFSDSQHFLKGQPLSYKLEYFFVRLQEAQPLVHSSSRALSAVGEGPLPADVTSQVEALKTTLPALDSQLQRMNRIREPLLSFLGHDTLQRYLIMFQNNTELRATGGFMGSFALVDLDRGEIKGIEIPGGGPYDLQGSLLDYYEAPRAMQLVNARWEFQDTNWFLDWPASAQTISRFYERAGGPSVDGVIAVDTHVMEELLRLVGPISLPEYQMDISADNFRDLLQEQVEVNYDRTENKPKKIIGDLAPELLQRVKDLPVSQSLELASVLGGLLDERSIQLYHNDEQIAEVFASVGWDGSVVDTAGDYVAVVHTNVAGGKTDGVIKDDYNLSVHIGEDGQVTNTLTVRREHTGKKGMAFNGVRNVNYMRVYVPEGSVLLSASGFVAPPESLFEHPDPAWKQDAVLAQSESNYTVDLESGTETYKESGKTVFANWTQVEPGDMVEVKLVYRSTAGLKTYGVPTRDASWTDWFSGQTGRPEQNVRVYSMYWQKQPGVWQPKVSLSVDYPQSWQLEPVDGVKPTESGPGNWRVQQVQDTDSWWNFVMY